MQGQTPEWKVSVNSLKLVRCEDPFSCVLQSNLDQQKTLCIVVASNSIKRTPGHLDSETVELIEQAPFPVLLFPDGYSKKVPWRSILVPMSGELRTNRALDLAISLGNKSHCPVDIVHVVEPNAPQKNHRSAIEKVSDEAHHELPEVLDDFISSATPFSNSQEKKIIRRFSVVQGKASEQIIRELKKRKADMIAVQWRGNFMKGRAETLKEMLEQLQLPILLVKPEAATVSRLRAGHQLA
jgi:nucleotide-binding universal stress UspA family protein